MSLYMSVDRPAPASRIRPASNKDMLSSPDGSRSGAGGAKRTPLNPKFAHVKSTLNTGANAGNVKPKVDRSGELFRRVNRRQLHQLMGAVEAGDESIYALQDRWDEVDDQDNLELSSVRSGRSTSSLSSTSSSLSSTGGAPTIVTHHRTQSLETALPPSDNEHFLLLDMRDDEEQVNKLRIQGAVHYPPPLLRRDHFTPQIYKFKNKPDKLIILYDTDDTSRTAMECAVLFIQKGFDNIFVLTGGLKHFSEKYVDRIEGSEASKVRAKVKAAAEAAAQGGHGRTGSVSNRSQALAGTPAPRGMGATGRLGASSSRPLTGATSSSAMSSSRPVGGVGTSLGATSLAGGARGRTGRESPREALGRSQQAQRGATSSSSSASSTSQISARPFR